MIGSILCLSFLNAVEGQEAYLVKDINTHLINPSSTAGSNPRNRTAMGDRLFFTAKSKHSDDWIEEYLYRALWMSDGSPEGTRLVKDISPASPNPFEFIAAGDRLFFSAPPWSPGQTLWELYVSDGS